MMHNSTRKTPTSSVAFASFASSCKNASNHTHNNESLSVSNLPLPTTSPTSRASSLMNSKIGKDEVVYYMKAMSLLEVETCFNCLIHNLRTSRHKSGLTLDNAKFYLDCSTSELVIAPAEESTPDEERSAPTVEAIIDIVGELGRLVFKDWDTTKELEEKYHDELAEIKKLGSILGSEMAARQFVDAVCEEFEASQNKKASGGLGSPRARRETAENMQNATAEGNLITDKSHQNENDDNNSNDDDDQQQSGNDANQVEDHQNDTPSSNIKENEENKLEQNLIAQFPLSSETETDSGSCLEIDVDSGSGTSSDNAKCKEVVKKSSRDEGASAEGSLTVKSDQNENNDDNNSDEDQPQFGNNANLLEEGQRASNKKSSSTTVVSTSTADPPSNIKKENAAHTTSPHFPSTSENDDGSLARSSSSSSSPRPLGGKVPSTASAEPSSPQTKKIPRLPTSPASGKSSPRVRASPSEKDTKSSVGQESESRNEDNDNNNDNIKNNDDSQQNSVFDAPSSTPSFNDKKGKNQTPGKIVGAASSGAASASAGSFPSPMRRDNNDQSDDEDHSPVFSRLADVERHVRRHPDTLKKSVVLSLIHNFFQHDILPHLLQCIATPGQTEAAARARQTVAHDGSNDDDDDESGNNSNQPKNNFFSLPPDQKPKPPPNQAASGQSVRSKYLGVRSWIEGNRLLGDVPQRNQARSAQVVTQLRRTNSSPRNRGKEPPTENRAPPVNTSDSAPTPPTATTTGNNAGSTRTDTGNTAATSPPANAATTTSTTGTTAATTTITTAASTTRTAAATTTSTTTANTTGTAAATTNNNNNNNNNNNDNSSSNNNNNNNTGSSSTSGSSGQNNSGV